MSTHKSRKIIDIFSHFPYDLSGNKQIVWQISSTVNRRKSEGYICNRHSMTARAVSFWVCSFPGKMPTVKSLRLGPDPMWIAYKVSLLCQIFELCCNPDVEVNRCPINGVSLPCAWERFRIHIKPDQDKVATEESPLCSNKSYKLYLFIFLLFLKTEKLEDNHSLIFGAYIWFIFI